MNRIFSLRNFDWLMFLIVCLFLVISFLFVWSASSEKHAFKQIIWIGIGMGVFPVLLVFDYFSIGKASYVFI